jgi:hypothetical protein
MGVHLVAHPGLWGMRRTYYDTRCPNKYPVTVTV